MANFSSSAFSMQMLVGKKGRLEWEEIDESEFVELSKNSESRIGNLGLSNIFNLAYDRKPICLHEADVLYLAQPVKGVIPENAMEIPKDCRVKFYKIKNEVL